MKKEKVYIADTPLIDEWDYEKNVGLDPTKITIGSGIKAQWICHKCGSEFPASITNRTKGRSCPYCSGKKANDTNSLAHCYPELAKEWHPTKNGKLTANDVLPHSNKKAWWKDKLGHEWLAVINNRTNGCKCPYCSNKKLLKGFNDLATKFSDIAEEWHPLKNGKLTPCDVVYGSNKEVWWLGKKCGHEWQARINDRVSQKCGCPYCANQRVLQGFNDLVTKYPDIANEWNYKRNNITPNMVIPGSNKKYWWLCKFCGYEWQAEPNSRISGTGCPRCNCGIHTSFPEQAIYFYIKQAFPDAINSYKDIFPKNMELDVYVPSLSLGIEYDGVAWHGNNEARNREIKKEQICKENNIKLIRIREGVETHKNTDVVVYVTNSQNPLFINEAVIWLFNYINKNICHITAIPSINVLEDQNQILSNYTGVKRKNTLEYLFPDITKEWDYNKNGLLLPSMFTPTSKKKVSWKCLTHNVSYEQTIADKCKGHSACPLCKEKKFKDGAKTQRKSVLQLETGYIFSSISEAQTKTGIRKSSIVSCCKGKYKTAGGYHWQYA